MTWKSYRDMHECPATCTVQVTLADVLRAVQPDMHSIIVMRAPADRMYSAFWYYGCTYGIYGRWGMHAQGFHAMAQYEIDNFQGCLEKGRSVRRCSREQFGAAQQLVKGIYAAFAPDWLAAFPADQLLWVKAEDYYKDERRYIQVRLKLLLWPKGAESILS
jgi:hypothetical protein